MLLTELAPDALADAVKLGKSVYRTQGTSLGDLALSLNAGTLSKICLAAGADFDQLRGAKTVFLGGSIATTGYSGAVVPHVARLRIKTITNGASDPALVNFATNSADVGAFGSWHAQPRAERAQWAHMAREIHRRNRIPLLACVDVGGTKIHIVLAVMDSAGELTDEVVARETFPTPRLEPDAFYSSLARRLSDHLRPSAPYEMVDVVVVGQPGGFRHPRDVVADGTARDLGDFVGISPAARLREWLAAYTQRQFGVLVCNDGRAQLAGLVRSYLRTETACNLWSVHGQPIVYLGLGTGLGFAACRITLMQDHALIRSELSFLACPALTYLPINEAWLDERLGLDCDFCDPEELARSITCWGDLLSSKFIVRSLALAEERAVRGNRRLFTSIGAFKSVPPEILRDAVAVRRLSLIDPEQYNAVMTPFVPDHQAAADIDMQRPWLETKLQDALLTMKREIGESLPRQLLDNTGAFYDVTKAVLAAHQRGKLVFFVGVGKSDAIARHLARIFENLGIRSSHVRLTAANAENLTGIQRDDLVFFVSYSGKAAELLNILSSIQAKGCRTVAISGSSDSELATRADWFLSSRVHRNPAPVAAAPTTSTTAALACGTAVAIVVSRQLPHSAEDFLLDRPGESIEFIGSPADRSFDEVAMALDVFHQLAAAIGHIGEHEEFPGQCLDLVRRVLATHRRAGTTYLTGAGSSLDVAEKVAETLTSIGVNAFALSPIDIPLGDLGHINHGDLVVFISYSGETRSLARILESVQAKGADCALITASRRSTLAEKLRDQAVIAGEGLDDDRIAPVPGQKILASFVNLAVGDAVAVLLAHLIHTTEEQFASTSHPGGAVGRTRAQESESRLSHMSETSAESEASDERRLLMSYIRRRDGGVGREAIVIGMGATGLGLLGFELAQRDYAIFFVDRNGNRVAEMQQLRQYRVRLCPGPADVHAINKVSSISDGDLGRLAELGIRIDHVFVSIGRDQLLGLDRTIAAIVKMRYRFRIHRCLNIVFVENFSIDDDILVRLKRRVARRLGDPDLEVYLDNHVAFVPAVDEALLPEVSTLRDPLRRERLAPPLYVDVSAWKGDSPFPWEGTIRPAHNFRALHRRKLWGHNLAHAITAYVGAARGHQLIHEAVIDPAIGRLVREALSAVGQVLYARERLWDEHPLDMYVEGLLARYQNSELGDTVARVARDPLRKLESSDRLIGPINYVARYGGPDPHAILVGAIAAAEYAAVIHRTTYDELRSTMIARLKIDDALKRVMRAEEEFRDLAFCRAKPDAPPCERQLPSDRAQHA